MTYLEFIMTRPMRLLGEWLSAIGRPFMSLGSIQTEIIFHGIFYPCDHEGHCVGCYLKFKAEEKEEMDRMEKAIKEGDWQAIGLPPVESN